VDIKKKYLVDLKVTWGFILLELGYFSSVCGNFEQTSSFHCIRGLLLTHSVNQCSPNMTTLKKSKAHRKEKRPLHEFKAQS